MQLNDANRSKVNYSGLLCKLICKAFKYTKHQKKKLFSAKIKIFNCF